MFKPCSSARDPSPIKLSHLISYEIITVELAYGVLGNEEK